MNPAELISRLVELEKAAIKCDRSTIHTMLLRVEEGVLQLEKLTIETLRENAQLRQRLEGCGLQPIPAEFDDPMGQRQDG